jgi:hypothetical protein
MTTAERAVDEDPPEDRGTLPGSPAPAPAAGPGHAPGPAGPDVRTYAIGEDGSLTPTAGDCEGCPCVEQGGEPCCWCGAPADEHAETS